MNIKHLSFFAATALAIALTSCKDDKKIESETNNVSTSSTGSSYTVDPATSKIEWKGYKVVKSENTSHIGFVTLESGELTAKDGKLESGKFVADMSTLTSEDLKNDAEQLEKLNGHLKSADFFNVEKFPTASFEITEITDAPAGSDYNTVLDGNFTMKGITKPVSFNANVKVSETSVSIATQPKDLNREDFGVKFQMPVANGLIKEEITIQILVNANPKK